MTPGRKRLDQGRPSAKVSRIGDSGLDAAADNGLSFAPGFLSGNGVIALLRKISAWMTYVSAALWFCNLAAADLVDAARGNQLAESRELLAGGADVNLRGSQQATALHWAAFNGNLELVRMLLDAGARVDASLENGSTPLHLAAFEGHTDVVRLLLQHGADAGARTLDGITPVAWARREQHQETLQALVAGRSKGRPLPRAPKPGSATAPADSDGDVRRFRVQLVAVSSKERARAAIDDYGRRFGDILQDMSLLSVPLNTSQARLYRVQSEAVPRMRANAVCERLKRRGQSCLVRAADSP